MRFSFTIACVPGKDLNTADTPSRAPVSEGEDSREEAFRHEVKAYVNAIVRNLPATDKRLKAIQDEQNKDPVCCKLKEYCEKGEIDWNGPVKQYLHVRTELSVVEDLLMRGNRVVIPLSMRADILEKLHTGHQGTTKCRQRAKESVWWPGIQKAIDDKVSNCPTCCKHQQQHPEPLMPSPLSSRPWEKIGTDLFEWKKVDYLFVVDYYSHYIKITKLTSTSATSIITHLK